MSPSSIEPPVPSHVEGLAPRTQFPIFQAHLDLVYLDSAATAQKPQTVLEAEQRFYATSNANVHRGVYVLAEHATKQYEAARATVASFVSGTPGEIVFTRGATEAINLVANSFVRPRLTKKHQIIVTIAEHHSNFVPWQQLAKETGAKLTVVPLKRPQASVIASEAKQSSREVLQERLPRPASGPRNDGENSFWQLDLEFLEAALAKRPTAIVAVTHVSNVLGSVNPIHEITQLAHRYHAPVLVDAAQSLAHLPVNVNQLGADFVVGSGHKLYGPTGIGLLWAQRELLETMPPYQFGGEMIRSVTIEETTWNDAPWKFEAGTPNIAGAIGLAAALDFITSLGWETIANHEEQLLAYADEQLRQIPGLTILGPHSPTDRAGLIAFSLAGIHPHDLVSILDEQSVELRAGRHCAQPLHDSLGLPASARASFGVYNSSDDIDRLVAGLVHAQGILGSHHA